MLLTRYRTVGGRLVEVEQCDGEPDFANPVRNHHGFWVLGCTCCKSALGEHQVGRGPEADVYECVICEGAGEFNISLRGSAV